MVHRCCITSCGMNVRVAEAKGLTYHCFPLKEPNRDKWIQVILPYVDKPESFKIVQGYTRVCSRHFRRKDYSLDSRKRARLNSNAIPSVFPTKSISAPVSTESLLENVKPLRSSEDSLSLKVSSETETNLNPESDINCLVLESAAISSDRDPNSDDFPSADEIDKLAYDLNSSFLDNECLKPLLLDLDEFRISDLEMPSSFNSDHWIDFGNDMISQLSHISFEPAAKVPKQPEIQLGEVERKSEGISETPKRKKTPPTTPTQATKVSSEIPTPKTSGTKKTVSKNNSNYTGRFSAERFRECDKDIHYYTGFSSYQSFEAFYHTLDAHAEKLKVTDIMYGATSLLQASSEDSTVDEHGSSNGPGPYIEDGRRLSQGRSMIRIDELFMTLIRLKRKLPEKVLGHMFCTSQSTVSRTVRAWTMLLSKVVETISKNASPKYRKLNPSPTVNTDENNSTASKGSEIPDSVIKLFHSDLARSIVSSGNSRKTSSSTFTSTSRSKRPKKEKITGTVLESPSPSLPSDSIDVATEVTTPAIVSILDIPIPADEDTLIFSEQVPGDLESCADNIVQAEDFPSLKLFGEIF